MQLAGLSARYITRWPAQSSLKGRARQFALAVGALGLAAAIAEFADAPSTVARWSLGTAYSALFLLGLSMVLGPLNVLRRKHNPVHSAVRRDVGIAAGLAGLIHTALGLQVHMGGVLSRYFIVPADAGASNWAFVSGNYVGLLSAIVLAWLVAISNNVGVRSLGLARWKKIQRMAYVAAAAAAIHGIIYQLQEKRNAGMIFLVVASVVVVVVLQLKGMRARRGAIGVTASLPIDDARQ